MIRGRHLAGRHHRSDRQSTFSRRKTHISFTQLTYLHEIASHVPLTTVIHGIFSSMANGPVIKGKMRVLDRQFEIKVGLLQLIIEEQIALNRPY
jgi:hypothetical protein